MLKTMSAVMVAAIVAAAFVIFPSLSPQVEAGTPVPGAKSDRLDMRPLGTACSERAWPYFEAGCLRDTRKAMGRVQDVRLVAMGRPADAVAKR